MIEAIIGIYGPLLGLLGIAIIWPFRILGLGICYLGLVIVWCLDAAHDYLEGWLSV